MSNHFEQIIENLRLKHEAFKAMNQPQSEHLIYDCPICEDREIVLVEQDDGSVSARNCECKLKKVQKRMFRASGLTEEQARLTLNDYNTSPDTMKMYQMVKRYIERQAWKDNNGFALFGSVGAGKTMLAQIIASEVMKSKLSVIFVPTTSLMAELRASQFSEDRSDFEQRIDKLINADMVIFDDVGKEKPTEWVQNQYFRIIDGRYNARKTTGFTSNYEFGELANRFSEFGDAIISRIVAMTRDYAVNVSAQDYRMTKK
jgi:DNA replication protein DnaC